MCKYVIVLKKEHSLRRVEFQYINNLKIIFISKIDNKV